MTTLACVHGTARFVLKATAVGLSLVAIAIGCVVLVGLTHLLREMQADR